MKNPIFNYNLLYVGDYFEGSNASHRVIILKKIFKKVYVLNYDNFTKNISGMQRRLFFMFPYGKTLKEINLKLIEFVKKKRINIVWFEKPIFIEKETLSFLKNNKVFTIDYTVDNPFGFRRHYVWHLYKKILNIFDINLVPRRSSVLDYKKKGSKNVFYYPLSYSELIHFAPVKQIKKKYDISFVGTPYTNRAEIIENLYKRFRVIVAINGNVFAWKKKLTKKVFNILKIKEPIYDKNYREKIWNSKINLSFTSTDNLDEYPYRILEIIMSGGFCLHQVKVNEKFNLLKKGYEIATFKDLNDLNYKIKFYLDNEKKRLDIIKRGQRKIRKLKLESKFLLINFFKKNLNNIKLKTS
jgi:spore maturation protein CgeB